MQKIIFLYLLILLIPSLSTALSRYEKHLQHQKVLLDNDVTFLKHRENYLLPVTHNSDPNNASVSSVQALISDTNTKLDYVENKYQLSFKFLAGSDLFVKNDRLWAGYTQKSLWQIYNFRASQPFRDTNYEPELFYVLPITDSEKEGSSYYHEIAFGYVHQSNGQYTVLSRSWDRIYMESRWAMGSWIFSFKPWLRVNDHPDNGNDPIDPKDDDNPDIMKYMGYFNVRVAHLWEEYSIEVLLRNNLSSSQNRGYVEANFQFPCWGKLKGHFQILDGYGETLLDYNHRLRRVGLGIGISTY